MIRLRDKLTLPSRIRYMMWRAGLLGRKIQVQLRSGEWLLLCGLPYELEVAYEIFVAGGYRCPKPLDSSSVSRIVDVGSNAGYSVIYWGAHFPQAHIDAFEPHPKHVDQLRRSVEINRLGDRVTVHPVAAGTAKGKAELTDMGAASAVLAEDRPADSDTVKMGIVPIEVVDLFEAVGDARIDLLKLDCEGAEYELLMDHRFATLRVSNLVMEWHETSAHPRAEMDLAGRLRALGWQLHLGPGVTAGPIEGLNHTRIGLLWAFARPETEHQ